MSSLTTFDWEASSYYIFFLWNPYCYVLCLCTLLAVNRKVDWCPACLSTGRYSLSDVWFCIWLADLWVDCPKISRKDSSSRSNFYNFCSLLPSAVPWLQHPQSTIWCLPFLFHIWQRHSKEHNDSWETILEVAEKIFIWRVVLLFFQPGIFSETIVTLLWALSHAWGNTYPWDWK